MKYKVRQNFHQYAITGQCNKQHTFYSEFVHVESNTSFFVLKCLKCTKFGVYLTWRLAKIGFLAYNKFGESKDLLNLVNNELVFYL